MKVCWFSCGISSAVAAWMVPDARLVRIRIDDEHPDNDRFAAEVSESLGREVEVLQSPYRNVEAVIRATRFINGPSGAACTRLLKRRVREQWESIHPGSHEYVWGYDLAEQNRLDRAREREPQHVHHAPLIDAGLGKAEAHGLFARVFRGIARPAMYELGFGNNNCRGCIKGGMGYWNRVRELWPDVFDDRARLEREIGRSCINGTFLDELDPSAGRLESIDPVCGLSCLLAHAEGQQ
jgi:hypothetical protein